jgi:diguanylate cyclase (GGDEF)-like protein
MLFAGQAFARWEEEMDFMPEKAYDDITDLAALICGTSIALVSLTDDGRQLFKSQHGVDAKQVPRAVPFCEQTMARPDELLVVRDVQNDDRFAGTPQTIDGMPIRFYAGAPLVTSQGETVGTLCVIDQVPRELTQEQQNALWALSRQVIAQVELTNAVAELKSNTAQLRTYQSQLEEYHRKLELTNARLRTLSVTDDLTGLNNRFAFEEELRNEFDRARHCDSPLSLLFLDADHFKVYNDEFGHPAGDDALRLIAAYLKKSMRGHDFVARIGGDEFVIILPGTTRDSACVLAERCRKALVSATWPKRPLTVSIGIASLDGRTIDKNTLLSEADQALYHAKETGRNKTSRASDLTEEHLLVGKNFVPRVPPH